ncbi:MAG: radical SAM protein [Syntrophaceae bacterium]|nr:radical SAM protein [Syntrophaceae bacterium]
MTTTPIIIPIFLPNLGCRERCLFCNQKVTAKEIPSPLSVRGVIQASLAKLPSDKKRKKEVAFYGGTFTAIEKERQILYLKEVQPFLSSGLIDSVRISTRPDALDEEILSLLWEYGVRTVEVGAQSMIDQVLMLARRGHNAENTICAVRRLRSWGFEVGIHLMIGLPGDSLQHFSKSLDRLTDLKPDFVRIHPTLVLKGAPLEKLWRDGGYSPLSLDEAVQWLKRGVLQLERASIPVARIGLQATKDLERSLLAGAYHPALHQLVDSAIFFDMARSLLQLSPKNGSRVRFLCHPKEVSDLRGQRNENILRLKEEFKPSEILIHESEVWPKGSLGLQTKEGRILFHRRSLLRYHSLPEDRDVGPFLTG